MAKMMGKVRSVFHKVKGGFLQQYSSLLFSALSPRDFVFGRSIFADHLIDNTLPMIGRLTLLGAQRSLSRREVPKMDGNEGVFSLQPIFMPQRIFVAIASQNGGMKLETITVSPQN